MRYISKHEADVYLDKEKKNTQSRLWTDKKRPQLQRFFQMSSLDRAAVEPIPVLVQCCGMDQYLFYFSLFLIEKPEATSLTTNGQK